MAIPCVVRPVERYSDDPSCKLTDVWQLRQDDRVDLIKGIAFAGYRSFPSSTLAVLAPLSRINLIAGQNNTGKSNVLRLVANTLNKSTSSEIWDRPLGDPEHRPVQLLGYDLEDVIAWVSPGRPTQGFEEKLRSFVARLRIPMDGAGADLIWLGPTANSVVKSLYREWANEIGSGFHAAELSGSLTSTTGGGRGQDALRVIEAISARQPELVPAYRVEGIREISSSSDQEPDLNGRSIKRRLLQLQAPSTENLADKEKFLSIQEFVRAVLDDPTVTIDVPHDLSTIHVSQQGRTLPIEHIGTGVHEVVIMAAAATVVQDSVMCIEEPEVHLHPVLQRKLLSYLAHSTSNYYFIATHSAHMLDSELGKIFHVSRSEGKSAIRFAGSARERAAVCADLGYRPSDLVQTNAILWVEGPSDRTYLKHLIEKLAPGEYIEGTHYSIMFYGGSLLSELSPLDADEVDEFISLRALNRYMLVMIDSDKTRQGAPLNSSKRRVVEALEADPSTGLAWVTAGYTVENYVPENVLNVAIRSAHPSTASRTFDAQERWADPLATARLGLARPSKTSIAKRVVESWGDEWPYDLKRQVTKVVSLIHRANAHS